MKYAFAIMAIGLGAPAMAQQDFSKVEIKAEQLAPGVAVLFGAAAISVFPMAKMARC
jgi:hypothetical protein